MYVFLSIFIHLLHSYIFICQIQAMKSTYCQFFVAYGRKSWFLEACWYSIVSLGPSGHFETKPA